MKTVALLSRKGDTSRAAFREYYEQRHCTLAMQHFPYRRYIRNHLLGSDDSLGFDCISEFGLAEDFRGVQLIKSHSRRLMEADERMFMQSELIRVAAAEERCLFNRANHDSAQRRRHVLLFRSDGNEQQQLQRDVELLGVRLARQMDSVQQISMDILSSYSQQPFPFDALLWIQLGEAGGLQEVVGSAPGLVGSLEVMTHTSSEDELKERFVAFQP